MSDADPNIVTSSLSRGVTGDGITVRVEIYRLEHEPGKWVLEVVNAAGTSTVWDDAFATDEDAYEAFCDALDTDGFASFLDSSNVVPFRR